MTLGGAKIATSNRRVRSFFNLDIFQSGMEAPRTKMLYNLTRRTNEILGARLHDSCVYNCTAVTVANLLGWDDSRVYGSSGYQGKA
jgi:hypothetical protein